MSVVVVDVSIEEDEINTELDVGVCVFYNKHGPIHSDSHQRSPQEIKDAVLRSERVKQVMRMEAEKRGWAAKHVEIEAVKILDEMGHNLQMGVVRSVGYALTKVIQRLFTGIFVNVEKMDELRRLCASSPVILMPTHKTYLDFLLVSFLSFAYELPLPAIAAGQDFMAMKMVGELLRRCGAFFIRRSFGQDDLYWAIFTEYLQTHLRNGDMPLEFFIEGTRSRTGKSLLPKYGLFTALLEPYLRSQVYDLTIVPVSINYSKILEEGLYAYELLGFPKPKESTSGLLKATRILNENFGQVFVTFGDAISVRDYLGTTMHRSTHALEPYASFGVSPSEKCAIVELAHRIVKVHQANSEVSLWSLASIVIGRMFASDQSSSHVDRGSRIRLDALTSELRQLVQLVVRLGHKLPFLDDRTFDEQLDHYLKLHKNLLEVEAEARPVTIRLIDAAVGDEPSTTSRDASIGANLISNAVPRVIIANYANQAMHWFADEAFVSMAIRVRGLHVEDVRDEFRFLQSFFCRDFVCVPSESNISFDAAVDRLSNARSIQLFHLEQTEMDASVTRPERSYEPQTVRVCSSADLEALAAVVEPFVVTYWLVCRCLMTAAHDATDSVVTDGVFVSLGGLSEVQLARLCQRRIADALTVDVARVWHQMMSMDTIKNALGTLLETRALRMRDGGRCECDVDATRAVADRLGSAVDAMPAFGGGERLALAKL